ncbi:hypothetical protein ACFQ23_08900 [Schaalia naturae]|uniref:Uncharacterized protein n=1 Tax=Schaalia naturae TaxID=635203 RepID=A0ABW2SNT9_9ACTO
MTGLPESLPPPSPALAAMEVEADPACARLGPLGRQEVAARAFAYGAARGHLLPERPCARAVSAAARDLGAGIRRSGRAAPAGVLFFGDYSEKDHMITLYTDAIGQYARHLRITADEAEAVTVAHELFHHLEATGQSDVYAEFALPRFALAGRPVGRLRPRSVAEAAAHGFASVILERTHHRNEREG